MKRLILLILVTLLMLSMSTLALAQTAKVREFVPVQNGPQSSGDKVATFAPDRIIIKFTAKAMQAATLDIPLEKGALVQNARTGLASLDAILSDVSALSIERLQGEMDNSAKAASLGVYDWFIVTVPKGTDIETFARRMGADANLEHADPDYVVFPAAIPSDPQYSTQWGHNNTAQLPDFGWGTTWDHTGPGVGTVGFDANAQVAWDGSQGYGYSSIIIAIIDSGVDSVHPDLLQVPGYDYGDGDNNPHDDSAAAGHGTACAGVAAAIANNSLGVAGIAGGCSIMPLKVAATDGSMYLSSSTNALYFAANNGADVASMSFGADIPSYASMDAAIQYAHNNGVIMLAATGNENNYAISYPANNQYVMGVGAASPCGDRKRSSSNSGEVNPGVSIDPNGYTCDGERWWGSNYGSVSQDNWASVDIIAPTILPTTDISGSAGYESGDYSSFFNGTSCATPYAAGVAALIKAANSSFTPTQIWNQMTSTAIDIVNVESGAGWDRYSGYGMVDAAAAVAGGVATAPIASFTSDATTGCVPQTINFTNTSTGTITSYAWTFGDGSTSTLANPSYSYTIPGNYTVSLTVTGPVGTDTMTVVGMISVSQTPVADFSALNISGPAPLTVDFTDLSTGGNLTWTWYFGEGGSSTLQNPSYTYNTPGTYSVTLAATNGCGQNYKTYTNLIDVLAQAPPVASFTASATTGCTPLDVDFTDTSTGDIDNWFWEFGDGQTSTEQNPSHQFMPGPWTVALTVNGPGGSDIKTETDLIFVSDAPMAMFSVSDTLLIGPYDATFTDQSLGIPTSWAWDFGDGVTDTLQNPTHSYTADGTYTITLMVTNTCGSHTLIKTDLIVVQSASGAGDVVAARFDLGQNYPNPFNPMTTIVYNLAKEGHARLEIYDATGRLVDTLVDEHVSAGQHKLTWQPVRLASGIYFARFTANGQTATNRMALIR